MPKIDRVIFTVTDNPLYTGFCNYIAGVWEDKFHIHPTLFFYGTPDEFNHFYDTNKPRCYVHRLERVPEVTVNLQRDWACTWSLIFGPTLFPDQVCMTVGIDQVPLNGVILDHIKAVDRNQFIVGLGNAYGDPRSQHATYPSSHLVGTGQKFREVFGITGTWSVEVRKAFARRANYPLPPDFWGLDEAYASELIRARRQTGDVTFLETFHQQFQLSRLWRGKNKLKEQDLAGIRSGTYSEWHADRPFEANDPKLLAKIKDAIPEYHWT